MRWSEISSDGTTWTLPRERSKNGRTHTLPVTPLMLSIIESVPRRDRFDILFGYRHGFTGWSIGKRALDERSACRTGLITTFGDRPPPAWPTLACSRTSSRKFWPTGRGHKRGPAGIYNRSAYASQVRTALLMWSDHIRALVEGGERKVVPMRQVP